MKVTILILFLPNATVRPPFQLFVNNDGFRQELDEPRPMEAHRYRRLISAAELAVYISQQPRYPCLNKVLLHDSDSSDTLGYESSQHSFFRR